MKAYTSKIKISGTRLPQENPLPMFRSAQKDQKVENDGTLRPEELEKLGIDTGFRVLPYCMQDRYDTKRKMREYPTVVLENEILRAEFLPELGGRLYSLYDKSTGKELLFKNPVFQPANLAIRNAWFSGGIEWNIAQTGHTYTTCSPVYFARVKDLWGMDFLRMYDYERTRGIFWQIDFHLPAGSHVIYACVRIMNDHRHAVPMYWWTNTAIREEKRVRIFSGTKEVIYVKPASLEKENAPHGFGHGQMPCLPTMPETDVSYPLNSEYTNEYFFQNGKEEPCPWEAAAYDDGWMFLERSTQPLRIRKMFCWGKHRGGRHWLDFLSEPGQGNYVEIQAGLCPTQLHGLQMPGNSEIIFTQAFGSSTAEVGDVCGTDWETARDCVYAQVCRTIPEERLLTMHEQFVQESMLPVRQLLACGSGWGYLEQERRKKNIERPVPEWLYFPAEAMGEEERKWYQLLEDGVMPKTQAENSLRSWMTDTAWEPYLREAARREPDHPEVLIRLGVLLYENGREAEAVQLWERSLQIKESAMAYRNLAWHRKAAGQTGEAVQILSKAVRCEDGMKDPAYAQEYLALLSECGEYEQMWNYFRDIPKELSGNQRIIITVCPAALALGEYEFLEWAFAYPFSVIREGENQMCEVWFQYQARLELGADYTSQEYEECLRRIKREKIPPRNIDFRLVS